MNYVPRRLTAKIEHSLNVDRVTALMGPRQAGKTTLVRHLLHSTRDMQYYNLKDPDVRQLLKKNGRKEFAHYGDATIVLDEVQTVPSLLELIQLQVDEQPQEKGRFLLLGSNHLLLNRHIKESLAGRVAIFTLLPLSLAETMQREKPSLLEQILSAETLEQAETLIKNFFIPADDTIRYREKLEDLNLFGGYPEFLSRKDPQDRREWLSSYHQTYLETDLRQLVELRNTESFEIFEKMFAQRVGNLMNISELGRDCALSADTIRRFIGYYRQLFIGWQARPFYANPGKRMMKMSKYYFYDTGLLRSVRSDFSLESGQYFENTVLTEVKKTLSFQPGEQKLYFSRTATGVEVDAFCTSLNGRFSLFMEIKQSEKIRKQDTRHLKKYLGWADKGLGLVLNNGTGVEQLADKIWAVPAGWLFC